MIQAFIGPIANLAGSWLQGKADKTAAEARLKLTEAETKSKILLSEKTSVADWERIMAQGTQNSWKDEYLVLLFSIPLVLSFCGEFGRKRCRGWLCCIGSHARVVSIYVGRNCG